MINHKRLVKSIPNGRFTYLLRFTTEYTEPHDLMKLESCSKVYCTFHRRANGHRIQQERVVLAGEKYQKPTASNYRMHIFKYAQKNPCHISIHISECWSHPIDGVQLVVDHSFVSRLKQKQPVEANCGHVFFRHSRQH